DSSSDFYPLGPEISQTNGYQDSGQNASDGNWRGAIVDCHFVAKNASWIFRNPKLWGADASGNVTFKGTAATATLASSASTAGSITDHNTLCESHGLSL